MTGRKNAQAPQHGSPGRRGVIYVLKNPGMPGFLKIGQTTRTPEVRARELSRATGVPDAFEVIYYIIVSDIDRAERAAHTMLAAYRKNKKREFFRVETHTAINALLKVAEQFPVNEDEATSREILPELEIRMRRWLCREIISVVFQQFSDLCILRVTKQPDLNKRVIHTTATSLHLMPGYTFDPKQSIDHNVRRFVDEVDTWAMILGGLDLFNNEARLHIIGSGPVIKPPEVNRMMHVVKIEGWGIGIPSETQAAS